MEKYNYFISFTYKNKSNLNEFDNIEFYMYEPIKTIEQIYNVENYIYHELYLSNVKILNYKLLRVDE